MRAPLRAAQHARHTPHRSARRGAHRPPRLPARALALAGARGRGARRPRRPGRARRARPRAPHRRRGSEDGPRAERGGTGPGSGSITLRDVDAALARNDLEAADTFAHALSSSGSDGPTARAVIAWCSCGAGLSCSNDSLERALLALDKTITGDPECVRALFYRAQIADRLGRTEAAVRDHQKVVRLEPRHVEARRELRLHEMRRGANAGGLRSVHVRADRTPANTNANESRDSAPAGAFDAPGPGESGVRSGLRRLIGRVVGK